MIYDFPTYPTNRLETLIHLDKIARAMIDQHDSNLEQGIHQGVILPIGEITHVGTMVMTGIKLLTLAQKHHYTIVYDPHIFEDQETITLSTTGKLSTSFGHQIPVQSNNTTIPVRVDELCCAIQLYDHISQLTIITTNQDLSQIDSSSSIIWIAGNLHHHGELEQTLIKDESMLTALIGGKISDSETLHHDILTKIINHYHLDNSQKYQIVPVSYHNTALLDGQKNSTYGYCVAMILSSS